MSIISKLIIKEWLKMFAAAFAALSMLITTADVINGFLRGKNFADVFMEYALKMPDLSGKMIPITCLIATLFSFNKLKSKSELIAIFATGYSYSGIYRLLILCSLAVSIIQFANLGFIEPFANKIKREKIAKSKINEGKFLTRSVIDGGKFWYRTNEYFVSFSVFDRKENKMVEPNIYRFDQDMLATDITTADSMTYDKEKGEWIGRGVNQLTQLKESDFPKETLLIKTTINIREKPEDFLEFEADLTTLSFDSLYRFIKRIKKSGINISEYEVLLYQKVSLSLICIIFALIPLSTIFNPNRRSDSFGKSVVFTIFFTILFWLLFSLTTSMGQTGRINSILSTFLIPIIFTIYVIFNYVRHRKLSF